MIICGKDFDFNNRTYIMGILNVTQDSFSDGGKYSEMDAALFHAEKMINEGVHIIDIGGESTRPGYIPVSSEEEIARTAPVIEAIKDRFDIPISLDTQKYIVAKEGIRAGADIVNDIWGFMKDPDMARITAESGAACVLMHNRNKDEYDDLVNDVLGDLAHCAQIAIDAGVSEDRIILDPGIGFAKTTEENLIVLNNMDLIGRLGYPWLLGASRKSVIGNTLNLPVNERLEGTLALTALAVEKGAAIVRVHDVAANKRVVDMLEAVHGRN